MLNYWASILREVTHYFEKVFHYFETLGQYCEKVSHVFELEGLFFITLAGMGVHINEDLSSVTLFVAPVQMFDATLWSFGSL